MMTHLAQRTALLLFTMVTLMNPANADVFELRTYTTNEGRLDNLNARFREHTIKLFDKHGMTPVGYWVPTQAPECTNTLIYVLKHKSREAAKASWKAFLSDPEWKKVARESQVDGRILAKSPESVFLNATDYSPEFSSGEPSGDTVFELRVYRTNENKLKNLDARFRDHTIDLFSKHGMKSVAYWHPADKPDAADTLIYIIRHDSDEAAAASWEAFRNDPEWRKVAKESQIDGKILRESPKSTYMKATDYSAIK